MGVLRLILIGLMGYLFYRLINIGKPKRPKVNRGRSKKQVDPFNRSDIEEIPYIDVTSEETQQGSDKYQKE